MNENGPLHADEDLTTESPGSPARDDPAGADQPDLTHGPDSPNAPDLPGESDPAGEPDDPKDGESPPEPWDGRRILCLLYDLAEVLGFMTAAIMLVFAFAVRLNIVDGGSMRPALRGGDTLLVSDLCGELRRGDIVIVHKIDADPYDRPIVKRVIATGGETVDIDFDTWTLTVDGEVVPENYRWLNPERELLRSQIPLPVTLGEDQIFVMGDNRNGSADSRLTAIGPVDVPCVAGKAVARIGTQGGGGFAVFRNPFESGEKK